MALRSSPSAALFDVDGTLVDSNYLHVQAWQSALASEGEAVDSWRLHRSIGQDAQQLLASLVGERDEAWVERVSDAHSRNYRELSDRLKAFDAVPELLRLLHDRGVSVVLATSAPTDELERLREVIRADDAISAQTSADDVDEAKPDPGIVRIALERASAHPDVAVFIGDSTWDMIAARRAGVRAFGLRSGGVGDAELLEAGAEAVFDDPAELLERITELGLREVAP